MVVASDMLVDVLAYALLDDMVSGILSAMRSSISPKDFESSSFGTSTLSSAGKANVESEHNNNTTNAFIFKNNVTTTNHVYQKIQTD